MSEIINIFFKEKPSLVLLFLNKNNDDVQKTISSLSRDTNNVFCHTTNIIDNLQKNNIITYKKEGRNKIISLTSKGKKLAELMEQMMNVDNDEQTDSIEMKGGKKKKENGKI
jgi:predicted transcriptional regulator